MSRAKKIFVRTIKILGVSLGFLSSQAGCQTLTTMKAEALLKNPSKRVFKYNPEKRACVSPTGEIGLNQLNAESLFADIDLGASSQVIEGRDASCIDFSGVSFSKYLGVGYNQLVGWDFSGSDLRKAKVSFNFIVDAKFEGSLLEGLEVGYGRVQSTDKTVNIGDMDLPNP